MEIDDAESVYSTLDHIERLAARVATLQQAQEQAEAQLAHRVGTLAGARRITRAEAKEVYLVIQRAGLPGRAIRWNREMPKGYDTSTLAMANQWEVTHETNGPGNTWLGESMYSRPAPPDGQCVVYVLYDELNAPCYVGSTKQFTVRMRQHRRTGKKWVAWRAMACGDRTEAYEREREMLREYAPYLNKAV